MSLLPEVEAALRDAIGRDHRARAAPAGGRRVVGARRIAAAGAVLAVAAAAGVAIVLAAGGSRRELLGSPQAGPARVGEVRLVAARAPATVPAADAAALRQGNSLFAGRLLGVLARSHHTVAVSPFSTSEALAMTYAGARGQTAGQIASALDFSLPQPRLHAAFNAADQELKLANRRGATLHVVNALFGQNGLRFRQPFLQVLTRDYGAGMRTVDFAYHTEAAREAINRWVSRQTGGKIPHLLARGDIDDLTAFVLADAVYLDAKWLAPFRKQDTRQAPFHTPQGTVTVPTMHQTGYFPYHRGPGYQALEMPYRGRRLAFDILLPDPGQLQPLLHRIAAVGPLKLLGGLSPLTKVSLALPRLNLRTSLYLDAALKTLGMPLAFTPGAADLSGIALQPGRMYIKHVVHQSYLRVYEGGTVAAAATGVIGELEAAMATIPFDVNRPFVFVIRDVKTGAIVFLGTVSRP